MTLLMTGTVSWTVLCGKSGRPTPGRTSTQTGGVIRSKPFVELGLTAKQFFEHIQDEYLSDIFPDVEFAGGEVIEIDDGLQPYQFYVYSSALIIPIDHYFWSKQETL